jgi:hypothetical protein
MAAILHHSQESGSIAVSSYQEKIENILKLVVQTGQYPPPTMKVTNFNFNLKRRGLWGTQTLCHFNWWDIPGEICKMHNQDFGSMVSTSHGSCVFIDARALVYNPAYLICWGLSAHC